MKERPILFNGDMVRAILEGRKTQTRRIMKPQPYPGDAKGEYVTGYSDSCGDPIFTIDPNIIDACPYGVRGDHLWVRETWGESDVVQVSPRIKGIKYRADFPKQEPPLKTIGGSSVLTGERIAWLASQNIKWRPSIHMPRWASRITLEITGVRVQRVQEISEEDAQAEGVESPDVDREEPDFSICPQCGGTRLYTYHSLSGAQPDSDCMKCDTSAKRFHHLWDSIYAERGLGWEANPWVWALTFKRV